MGFLCEICCSSWFQLFQAIILIVYSYGLAVVKLGFGFVVKSIVRLLCMQFDICGVFNLAFSVCPCIVYDSDFSGSLTHQFLNLVNSFRSESNETKTTQTENYT